MTRKRDEKSTWRPMLLALAVGAVLTYTAHWMSGGGHGTSLPWLLFLGPLSLLLPIGEMSAKVGATTIGLTLFAVPLLYVAYAFALGVARSVRLGRAAFAALIVLHYGCFAFLAFDRRGDWSYFREIWEIMPGVVLASGLVFLMAQVVALTWVTRGSEARRA